jgi:hypothetical protein
MSMSVSRLRGKTPTPPEPTAGPDLHVPPFWELEDLLADGLACEAALQVMAARRAALRLVDGSEPEADPASELAARRFKLIF